MHFIHLKLCEKNKKCILTIWHFSKTEKELLKAHFLNFMEKLYLKYSFNFSLSLSLYGILKIL